MNKTDIKINKDKLIYIESKTNIKSIYKEWFEVAEREFYKKYSPFALLDEQGEKEKQKIKDEYFVWEETIIYNMYYLDWWLAFNDVEFNITLI